jgi:hypothetical protein
MVNEALSANAPFFIFLFSDSLFDDDNQYILLSRNTEATRNRIMDHLVPRMLTDPSGERSAATLPSIRGMSILRAHQAYGYLLTQDRV